MRNTKTKCLTVSGIIFLLLAGCSRPVQVDYYDLDLQKPLDIDQLIFRSSAIVVSTVKSARIRREGVPARRVPELLLDEVYADVDVENVVLGDVKQGRLQFSYFTISMKNEGGYSGPAPLRLEPGQRRIFFLTTDLGQYRLAADLRNEYSIRVWSGLHKDCCKPIAPADYFLHLTSQEQVRDSISEILMQLGENYDREGMIQWLDNQAYTASRLAGRQKSAALLKLLAADEHESGVAAKACLVLSKQYYGQYGCLARLEADTTAPPALHAELAKEKTARVDRNSRLKKQLRMHPLFAFEMSPFADSITGVQQELFMLADDPDPELKALACGMLQKEYAKRPEVCP